MLQKVSDFQVQFVSFHLWLAECWKLLFLSLLNFPEIEELVLIGVESKLFIREVPTRNKRDIRFLIGHWQKMLHRNLYTHSIAKGNYLFGVLMYYIVLCF